MLAIKSNMMAAGAARNLGVNYDNLATSVQRLSSGLRINSAKDDAAGLAVRELIRADVAALSQGARNANDGVSMLQAAEGALGEIDSILVRMRELSEQANTDTYSSDQKGIMQAEFNELASEIDRIVESTDFNDINLLDNADSYKISLGQGSGGTSAVTVTARIMDANTLGVGGTYETASGPAVAAADADYITGDDAADDVTFTVGGEALTVTVGAGTMSLQEVADAINGESRKVQAGWNAASVEGDATSGYQLVLRAKGTGDVANLVVADTGDPVWAAGVAGVAGTEVATSAFLNVDGDGTQLDISSSAAITAIDNAIATKDKYRAELGYKMNRLETAASVLDVQAENLATAESRISDVDVATEMSAMTRNQVLAQAGISMLSQANSMPQMALSLLG